MQENEGERNGTEGDGNGRGDRDIKDVEESVAASRKKLEAFAVYVSQIFPYQYSQNPCVFYFHFIFVKVASAVSPV